MWKIGKRSSNGLEDFGGVVESEACDGCRAGGAEGKRWAVGWF